MVAAVKTFIGETLELTGVLRQEMGTYLCIASNNVPPTVSKRYSVDVHCKYHVALRPLISRRSVVVALHTLAGLSAQTSSWLSSALEIAKAAFASSWILKKDFQRNYFWEKTSETLFLKNKLLKLRMIIILKCYSSENSDFDVKRIITLED